MKNTQLLSVIFSLILVSGVTSGTAFADLDDLEDMFEDYCEFSDDQKEQLLTDYDLVEYGETIEEFCQLDESEREDAIEEWIDATFPEIKDEEHDEYDDDRNDEEENDNDYEKYEKYSDSDIREKLDEYCGMSEEEKEDLKEEHDKSVEYVTRMDAYCELDNEEDKEDYIEEHYDHYFMERETLEVRLEMICEMTEEEQIEQLEKYGDLPDGVRIDLAKFCEMTEDQQEEFSDLIHEGMVEFRETHQMLVSKMQESHEEIREQKTEYKRFCKMSPEEREDALDDPQRLVKISEWCDLSPDERKEFQKEHRENAIEFKEKHHEALEKTKAKHELPPRIKTLILGNDDSTDEELSEIKGKFKEKYKDKHEKIKSELKTKFRDTISEMKFRFSDLTDEQKSDIKERHAEMKAFMLELREKSSSLTQEEKQELRAQFIEKAKDMQLAWISPRHQISAGIDVSEVECREGFSLVMKSSNGLPMCVKANTALKMIDKGIAVPAN